MAATTAAVKEPVRGLTFEDVWAALMENREQQKETDRRMEVLRRSANRRGDARKYQGAIAGAVMSQSVRNYVLKNGFYVIEQSGNSVKLTIPEGFVPREW